MRTDYNNRSRMEVKCLRTLLVNKFLHQYGYQNGPVVVKAIVDDILAIVEAHYLPVTGAIPPGTFVATVVSKDAKAGPYNTKLRDCPMVTVRLQLYTKEEMEDYLSGKITPSELQRRRVIRWFYEAARQGGYLTYDDACLFSGVCMGTMGKWVRRYQERNKALVPTRGRMHDIGRGVSHKKLIVRLYLEGKIPTEIARQTSHNVKNVSRYIKGFEIVRMLRRTHSAEEIPLLSGMSESLCKEYLDLCDMITGAEIVPQEASEELICTASGSTSRPSAH